METKSINSLSAVSANATRKMLCGDGVIPLSALKTFVIAELMTTLTNLSAQVVALEESLAETDETVASNVASLNQILQSITSITNRLMTLEASATLSGSVFEEDAQGNLTLVSNERVEWRTIKVADGVYSQKYVRITDE